MLHWAALPTFIFLSGPAVASPAPQGLSDSVETALHSHPVSPLPSKTNTVAAESQRGLQ